MNLRSDARGQHEAVGMLIKGYVNCIVQYLGSIAILVLLRLLVINMQHLVIYLIFFDYFK